MLVEPSAVSAQVFIGIVEWGTVKREEGPLAHEKQPEATGSRDQELVILENEVWIQGEYDWHYARDMIRTYMNSVCKAYEEIK
jgi:hypothetical protein